MSSANNSSSGESNSQEENKNSRSHRAKRSKKIIHDTDSGNGSESTSDGEGSGDGEENDFRELPVFTITSEMATDLDYDDDDENEGQRILELKLQRCSSDVRPGSSIICFKEDYKCIALENVSSDNTLWVKFTGRDNLSRRTKIHVRNIRDIATCHSCKGDPLTYIPCAERGCPRAFCAPLDKDCVKNEYLIRDAKLLQGCMFVCSDCAQDEHWDDFHGLSYDEYIELFLDHRDEEEEDLSAKKPKKKKRKESSRKVRYVFLTEC